MTSRIPAKLVRDMLHYEPATGVFVWRRRDTGRRADKTFNAVFAGTIAGTVDKHGYRVITILGVHVFAHRAAWAWMKGEWPRHDIDHRNLIPGDDRWLNLRLATKSQNMRNTDVRSDSFSGIKGVTRDKRIGRWQARIQVDGINRHLGMFSSASEAHAAYGDAAARLHGDFARTGN